jgi:hypothetical protein
LLRLSACAALVAGVFTGAWIARPVALRNLGLAVWELPDWQHRLDDQNERDRELDRRWQVANGRERRKNEICQELIAGRLSLREAATLFLGIPDPPEHLWEDLRFNYKQGTDDERLCRHVIEWACDLMSAEETGTAELRQRWEAELHTAALGLRSNAPSRN